MGVAGAFPSNRTRLVGGRSEWSLIGASLRFVIVEEEEFGGIVSFDIGLGDFTGEPATWVDVSDASGAS